MNYSDFDAACARTDRPDSGDMAFRAHESAALLHYSLGLCTEAAEIADALKKRIAYGKTLDTVNLVEECGDMLYYLSRMLNAIGSNIPEAMEKNVRKLAKRFPGGFTEEAALTRNLQAERLELEK
jgi:NTP pyrophosphatase (non-canonical NTP hydrolase)